MHFHGPKPWEYNRTNLTDLCINHYDYMRGIWMEYLNPRERALVESWA